MSDSSWVLDEFSGINFGDKRLNNRFYKLASNFSKNPQAQINQASEDWFDAKGSYRFFENDSTSTEEILRPHYKKTAQRASQYPFILALQDTTVFDYSRHQKTKGVGNIGGKPSAHYGTQGMVMHTTYALSPDGLPLGLLNQDMWVRSSTKTKKEKYDNRLLPIEEKETYKWTYSIDQAVKNTEGKIPMISICDREADIFDFFLEVKDLDSHFIVRSNHNRNVGTRGNVIKLLDKINTVEEFEKTFQIKIPVKSVEKVDKRKKNSYKESLKLRDAKVRIKTCKVTLSSSRKAGQTIKEKINLSFIEVSEINPPEGLHSVCWHILTSLEVSNFEQASLIVNYYSLRWRIENYFKILKSGCSVEKCRLNTGTKLKKYISIFSVIAWRLHWLTYVSRVSPEEPCNKVLTEIEWKTLYIKINKMNITPEKIPSSREVLIWLARLGGFMARKSDGEPGMISIWRGWTRLQDMVSIHNLLK